MYNNGIKTYRAGEDLEARIRVKIESGTTTTPPEVVYADAGEASIGVTEYSVDDGDNVAVRLNNSDGTMEIECVIDSAIARGAQLYGAADGKVTDTVSGAIQGLANQAASADNEHIEVISSPWEALAKITTHLLSAQNFIPVQLNSLREVNGDNIGDAYDTGSHDIPLVDLKETDATNILAAAAQYGDLGSDSTPILDHVNGDTDSNLRVEWAATVVDAVVFKVALPNIDTASDLTITLRAAMSDTNNTPVIDIDSYFGEADTKVSDATAAITGTTIADYVITIAAADIPSGATYLTCEMTPAAHANDIIYLYQVTVAYTSDSAQGRGVLGRASTPVLAYTNGDTDSALRVAWAAADQTPVVLQTPLPPDLDTSADLVLHMRAAMSNTNDTPTIASDVYFNEGDTKVEDVSAAITGTTYAEYTITIAAADIPTGAQTVTVELTPGAHATDLLYMTALWLEYTKAWLTSC